MNLATSLKEWVKQWTSRFVRYGFLAQTEPTGFDQLEGSMGEPGEPAYQHPIRRFQHYGFRSRPKVGAELICVAPRGGTSNRVSIASEVPGEGPQNQAEGEVELYSQFGQRIFLKEDGSIHILEASGGQASFTNKILSVEQVVESQHFQGKGTAPLATPGPGLGGGIALASGTDAGFTLNLVVKMPGPGPLATVFFSSVYQVPPRGIGLCAIDVATAKAMMTSPFYVIPSTNSLQIFADGLLPGSYGLSLILIG